MRYEIIKTYIADIKPGDCIMENGVMVTVSSNHIKRDPFLGTTLRGDSYNGGHKPEQKAFKPLNSIEDNQEKDMKQDNGWFERGELPPVGVKCETLAEPELQWVSTEVVAHRDGFAIVWITSKKCGAQSDAPKHFRPLRTERDVLIDVIKQWDGLVQTDEVLADAILVAGFSLGLSNAGQFLG